MGSCFSFTDCITGTEHTDNLLRARIKGVDFSLKGEEHTARVVEVYDGDTIRVIFHRNGEFMQHRVRMLYYDSAEITGKNRSDEEKSAAILARDVLQDMVQKDEQLVKLHCDKFDAFGRLLGTLYLEDGTNVNQFMINNQYGVTYTGGKKAPFNAANFRCE